MSSLNDGWRIPAHHEVCHGCERPLAAGDRVTTVLTFGEEGPVRQDLCEACGNSVGKSTSDDARDATATAGAPEVSPTDGTAPSGSRDDGPLFDTVFWRRRRPESASRRPVVDYALLREVFARLLGRPEPLYARLSYLVGLVLVRKRHLRLKGFEVRGGREVMLVTRGAGQPEIEVPAPYLSPEDMVATRDHLMGLLAVDLGDEGLPDLETLLRHPGPERPEASEHAEASRGAEASQGAEASRVADASRDTGEPDPDGAAGEVRRTTRSGS